jgi:hypothetical protein
MDNFKAHRLRFVTEVQTTIELNEHQGSAIRGALFHAMRGRFCNNRKVDECAVCPLVTTCPVATLLSTFKPGAPGGRDVPRPFTIQPPIANGEWRMANSVWKTTTTESPPPSSSFTGHIWERDDGRCFFHYRPGERFEFGLTLYAQALQLFPYVVLTVKTFEEGGIGRRMERARGQWRRGTVHVQEVWAENPLTGERQPVLTDEDNTVQVPDVPITHRQVCKFAGEQVSKSPSGQVALRFLTPTRLVESGRLVKPHTLRFKPLLQRLLDRLESLSRDFSDTKLNIDFSGLVAASEGVRVVDNRLWWEELRSYSTRRRAESPTSGLLGTVILEADDWLPFMPYLIWGQFTHVGKDATKGNGEYRIANSE